VDDPAELRSAVLGIAFELSGGPAEAAGQPGEAGGPAQAAGQPGEAEPGPARPPAAARTNGSTR
jgi:hypothetical protein